MRFFDPQKFHEFRIEEFKQRHPFPYHSFSSFLRPDAFEKLYLNFPDVNLFKWQNGYRGLQRPHGRYQLFYDRAILKNYQEPGYCTLPDHLPTIWQEFLLEIQSSRPYHSFIRSAFGVKLFAMRFEWHLLKSGTDISPHVDAPWRIGDHLFYFHSSTNWKSEWGGELDIFEKGSNLEEAPEAEKLKVCAKISPLEAESVLLKNSKDSWHGVSPIHCPPDQFRRVFLINIANPFPLYWKRVKEGARKALSTPP